MHAMARSRDLGHSNNHDLAQALAQEQRVHGAQSPAQGYAEVGVANERWRAAAAAAPAAELGAVRDRLVANLVLHSAKDPRTADVGAVLLEVPRSPRVKATTLSGSLLCTAQCSTKFICI
jgi:hypothetical protein